VRTYIRGWARKGREAIVMRRVLVVIAVLMISGVSLASDLPLPESPPPPPRPDPSLWTKGLERQLKLRVEEERRGAKGCIKVAQAVNDYELRYIEEDMKEMRTKGAKDSQEPLSTLIREATLRKIRGASLKEQLRLIESKESMLPACEAQVAKTLRDIAYDLGNIVFQLEQPSLERVLK